MRILLGAVGKGSFKIRQSQYLGRIITVKEIV